MDKTYRDIRNHEAAHAVVSLHFGVTFNRITQYKIFFPKEAALSEHFFIILASGCLGEFYEKQTNDITAIEIAIQQFSEKEYPEDYAFFTHDGTFNQTIFNDCLITAWPIVEAKWRDIEKLSQMLHIRREMSYEDVVEFFRIND